MSDRLNGRQFRSTVPTLRHSEAQANMRLKRFVLFSAFVALILGVAPHFTTPLHADSTVEILDGVLGAPAGGHYVFVAQKSDGQTVPFGTTSKLDSWVEAYHNAGVGTSDIPFSALFPNMSVYNKSLIVAVYVQHYASNGEQINESIVEILD